MAKLEFRGKQYDNPAEIKAIMGDYGVPFEHWGLRDGAKGSADDQVLTVYKPEVDKLMRDKGYLSVDLVALKPETPNLPTILAKFDKEHHHVDDEVRFTVEGEGVFEIEAVETKSDGRQVGTGDFLKFTAQPGDLIVIPAFRRHAFYLTEQSRIRCIRLFLTKEGWEAIYDKAQ